MFPKLAMLKSKNVLYFWVIIKLARVSSLETGKIVAAKKIKIRERIVIKILIIAFIFIVYVIIN